MPIIKSAKKRVRQSRKATARNSQTKHGIKDAIRSLHRAITGKKDASAPISKAQSAVDKAVKKGIYHKNKAARKQRQLAKLGKAAGARAAKKATTAKTPVKKAAPAAKKPAAAKKATAKKPAAKKTAAKKK